MQTLDQDRFNQLYAEYVEAVDRHNVAVEEARKCESGECSHDRPLRKDGKPNRGRPCPQGYRMYSEECDTGNAVWDTYHGYFFDAMGMRYDG